MKIDKKKKCDNQDKNVAYKYIKTMAEEEQGKRKYILPKVLNRKIEQKKQQPKR